MQTKHIADWLTLVGEGNTIEVRFRNAVIDAVQWFEDTASIAEELEGIAQADTDESHVKKPRVYQLVAIHQHTGERVDCPIPLRVKPKADGLNQSAEKLVATALTLIERMDKTLERMHNREERNEQRMDERFIMVEKLRSQVQERELEKERHDKEQERLQQMTDTGIPLMVALANKLTGGKMPMLGAVDTKSVALVSIVQSLSDQQQQQLPIILGDRMAELEPILHAALAGQGDVAAFRRFVRSLSPEQIGMLQSLLNVGQQAAFLEAFGDALTQN